MERRCIYCGVRTLPGREMCHDCYDKLRLIRELQAMIRPVKEARDRRKAEQYET